MPDLKSKADVDVDNILPLVLCAKLEGGDDRIKRILKGAMDKGETRNIAKKTKYLTFGVPTKFSSIKLNDFKEI